MAINPEDWFGKTAQDPSRLRTMWVDVKDPGLRQVLGIPEGGMPFSEFMSGPALPQQAPAPAVQPGAMTSFARGGLGLASDLNNFGQLVTAYLQMPEAQEYFARRSMELQERAEALPRAVSTIEDIKSPGNFATWAWETLWEQVPNIASFVLPGGIAGKMASMAGKSAKVAGLTAGFLVDVGLLTGESVGLAEERDQPITDLRVIGSGLGKAALDFIPYWAAARQLGIAGPLQKAFLKYAVDAGYLKRAAGNAAVIMATEVPTETAQEWINNSLDNYFTGYEGPITEEQKSRLYNAAAGASLFGVFGAYAPRHPAPPAGGITDADENLRKGLPSLSPLPTDVSSDLSEYTPPGLPQFDFRTLYDSKTGELTTTADDYMRIVQEQSQFVYDPMSETITQPAASAMYATVVPGWREQNGKWYLDAPEGNAEAGRAQITPTANGFEAHDVNNLPIGVYPDINTAMIGAANVVNSRGETFVVDQDGMRVEGTPDKHTQFVEQSGPPITPTDMAAVTIEAAKDSKKPSVLRQPMGEAEVSLLSQDAGLMQLLEIRDDFLADKDNYRSSDGELKKDAQKKLAVVDARIARYVELKRIPNPIKEEITSVVGEDLEAKLVETTNAEAKELQQPVFPNLNPFESKEYQRLNEKEMYEGLSQKEQDEWSRLKQKSETGSDLFGQYIAPIKTQKELHALSAGAQNIVTKVQKHRKRIGKNARQAAAAIAKMRGIQQAKRGGPTLYYQSQAEGVWPTDPDFYNEINAKYGFTLDAAASPENAKTPRYFTEEQDGLKQDWNGERVWVNPPYRNIAPWVEKAYKESQKGATVVMLLPANRTDVAWWHDWVEGKAKVQFIRGRIKFGSRMDRATFPSVLVTYGEENLFPAQDEPVAMSKSGWVATKDVEDVIWVSEENNAAITVGENGTFEGLKLDNKGNVYSLGTFESLAEAADVAQGASPAFMQEVYDVLKRFWGSFNIRPKLIIVSTADIINGKVSLTENDRETLLQSHGIFKSGTPGTVMLHVDPHVNVEDTVRTLVHEMLGHFGLRAVLPARFWEAVLSAYAKYNKERILQLEAEGRSVEGQIAREHGMERQADVLSADEAISYIAQKRATGNPLEPFEQSFLNRVIAQVKAWYRWAVKNFLPENWHEKALRAMPWNEEDAVKLLRDTAKMLRTARSQAVNTTHYGRIHVQSSKGRGLVDSNVDSLSDVWLAKSAGQFLQPLQHAERYQMPGTQEYIGWVQKWAARKAALQSKPVDLLTKWFTYNKRKSNRLSEVLLLLQAESDALGHAIPQTEEESKRLYPNTVIPSRERIYKEKGLDKKGIEIVDSVKKGFLDMLDKVEHARVREEIRRHVQDPVLVQALEDAFWDNFKPGDKGKNKFGELVSVQKLQDSNLSIRLNEIHVETNVMRDRDYFPYMRFGRYAIWIRANKDVYVEGKKYSGPTEKKRGQMIHFETYESHREMVKAVEALRKEYPQEKGFLVGTGYVSDQEYTMLGMPPALYETLRSELKLSDKQQEMLKEIYYTKSPGQKFLQNMVKRRGVRGFSSDTLRVYASYMMNAATHIARLEHGYDLDNAISQIRDYAQGSPINPHNVVEGHVRDYWVKHYKYIMNPETDWAGLRALGFLWYLGFNVKSAAVNLTQVPLVALPYLSARFGDTASIGAISKSYKDVFRLIKAGAQATGPLADALKWGVEEGFLDESLATELAGFAESSVMQRILPETDTQRILNHVMQAGAFMFRHVEKINRYVTFLAARELALKRFGNTPNGEIQARMEAKEAVQASMFEYAKWNRAPYMRGKKSVFFLFWSYMQGLAYLMAGGKGKQTAMRVWMMMLVAAGLQGIPFAENILDLFDWGSREMKEALGWKDPYTDSRLELRKLAQTITDSPDMLLHGWSRHYGLGPLHMLSLAGVPVPEVDISGSMSAGRWLPGTDKLTSTERDPNKKLGQTLVDVLGPVAGVGYGFWSAMVDDNPDRWKVWERAMPSALKAASQSVRRRERGEEEFRGGGTLVEFDPTNPEVRTGLWMNMLGFQPTKVGQAYEVIGTKENLRRYWSGRQAMVMENWAFAKRSGDPELMQDADNARREFNEQVPDAKLRLTPEKIRRSMKARAKRIAQREMGLPQEKGYRRLYEEIDQIYGLK